MVAQDPKVIRVVQVATRMNIGGASLMIIDLLNGLDETRFHQVLIHGQTSADEGSIFTRVRGERVDTNLPQLRRAPNLWRDLQSLIALVKALRRLRPHIVHTHMAKAGALGRLAAWMIGVPIRIHTYHGHLLTGYFPRWKTALVIGTERLLSRITTFAIVDGRLPREALISANIISPRTSRSIPPAVTPLCRHDAADVRRSFGLPSSGSIVGFVGRLSQIKRPDRVVSLARELPEMHFAIFGDGPLYHDIIKETKDLKNVTCLGWQVDLSRVMSSLSLLVLTSDNEGIPLSVMEAASIGIPTVALNSGGVSEFVLDGVTGMIVEHEEQLGHAITQLLTDYELLSRMGAAAQSRALKDFGLRQYLEAHEDIYLTLLKGRSPDTLR
jgi:glycosyltransferase involved in cell wall biosynthesis